MSKLRSAFAPNSRALFACAFLLVASVYVILVLVLLPTHVFYSGDAGIKFVQVQSLVRSRWRVASIVYPGRTIDPDVRFFPIPEFSFVMEDEVYFHYPLTFAALSSLFYAVLGQRGLHVLPLVSTLLTALLVYRWMRICAPRWAVVSVLLLGLATPMLFYSLVFWGHTVAVLLTTIAVYLLGQGGAKSPWWWKVVAGALLGLACWIRSECYLFALAVIGAWAATFVLGPGRPKSTESPVRAGTAAQRPDWRPGLVAVVWLGLGLLFALLPLWLWQHALYGNFLGVHLGWHVDAGGRATASWREIVRSVPQVAYTTLVQGYPGRPPTVFLAVAVDLGVVVLWVPRLRRQRRLVLLSGVLLLLASLPGLAFARDTELRGLLPVSPIVAFSLLPLGRHQGGARGTLTTFLLVLTLGYVVGVCVAEQVDPGLQWGPRMLLPLFPLLVVSALRSLDTLVRAPADKVILYVFAALAVMSLVIQGASVWLLYRNKQESLDLLQFTEALPVAHIATDVPWYPAEVTALYYERQFFYVADQTGFEELVTRFCEEDVRQFAWVPLEASDIEPMVVLDDCVMRQESEFVFEVALRGTEQ
jgi:hypothetical protein